jgi:hypothetical protein
MMSSFFRLAGVSIACALLGSGCVAEVRSRPAYAVAEYEPRDVESYPHTVYDGRRVYFIDGYWYMRNGPRWVYYREEPRELYRYRASVRSAPPARYERRDYDRSRYRREPERRRQAPPARDRDRSSAPRAVEIR